MQNYTIEILKLSVLLVVIIGIYIFQRILQSIVSRAIKHAKGLFVDDVINGIRVMIRLGAGIAIVYAIMLIYEAPVEINLMIATIIGAVVSFSSITAIQNFVAGLFILITQPFGIADLVSIGGKEGIVSELYKTKNIRSFLHLYTE